MLIYAAVECMGVYKLAKFPGCYPNVLRYSNNKGGTNFFTLQRINYKGPSSNTEPRAKRAIFFPTSVKRDLYLAKLLVFSQSLFTEFNQKSFSRNKLVDKKSFCRENQSAVFQKDDCVGSTKDGYS